jgi:HEPN domain-containing protein
LKMSELARDYLVRAKSRLTSAEGAMERGEFPDTVRYSQECVEFSLKSSLRFLAVEYPREHDVSDVLVEVGDSFPEWFHGHVEEIANVSRKLAVLRGPSTYGEEERGIPPSKLFGEKEASAALADAKKVHSLCSKLLRK